MRLIDSYALSSPRVGADLCDLALHFPLLLLRLRLWGCLGFGVYGLEFGFSVLLYYIYFSFYQVGGLGFGGYRQGDDLAVAGVARRLKIVAFHLASQLRRDLKPRTDFTPPNQNTCWIYRHPKT